MKRVAVVGGGTAGLAAALRLVEAARARAAGLEIVLLEAKDRLGGTIATERTGGFLIEAGADAFITEKPWALGLCERLGLGDRLIGTRPGDRHTYVVRHGRLVAVPEGFVMIAPTDPWTVATSPLFSWRGKLRMLLDLALPRRRGDTDESVAAFVRRRLGREALERVAEPLLGGIYTGDAERLSLRATMPRFVELERRHRSLIVGLRATARTRDAGARYSLFMTHVEGMGGLISDLARRLPEGVARLGAGVTGLARDGESWRLAAGGVGFTADALVIAVPAYAAASLLEGLDSTLARALEAIEHASSATVTLAYRVADLPRGLPGFGFVVPAVERRSILACSYPSRKFAGRAPDGHELVRAFVGGALRPDLLDLDDEALIALVEAELAGLLGVAARPLLVRVHRHAGAMPQYHVGHEARVAAIEARAAAIPNLALAGAAYHGVGVPDCVRSGEAAADAVLAALGYAGSGFDDTAIATG